MGAGAIGGYVGGLLQAAGARVVFVGRARVGDVLRRRGLTLTDLDGRRTVLAPAALEWLESPPAEPASLTLLTVKSGATAEAARRLAPGSVVLSLQNGVDNVRIAAAAAPALELLAGVVGWNVAELAAGHLHRGTDGVLAAEDHPVLRAWLPVFAAAGLPLRLDADLRALQWGKLLLNLNNPVNALSGLPLAAELLDRDCRFVLAALQQEALAVLESAGIAVEPLTPLAPRAMVALLRWPSWAFRLVAARTLRIDGNARSSMADDLARGRPTEIDALCGAIVRLAERHGRTAPLNSRLQALVEHDPRPRDGRTLRSELGV